MHGCILTESGWAGGDRVLLAKGLGLPGHSGRISDFGVGGEGLARGLVGTGAGRWAAALRGGRLEPGGGPGHLHPSQDLTAKPKASGHGVMGSRWTPGDSLPPGPNSRWRIGLG